MYERAMQGQHIVCATYFERSDFQNDKIGVHL